MNDVSLAAAFLAGLVSFLSPCVLPLVPGYISMLSGIGMEQLRKGEVPSSGLFASSLAFVAGFSVVFISFGPSMARWASRGVPLRSRPTPPGSGSGFLLGFAFAFGWTPCIGPILAAVLALAAASDTIARGVLLLAVYSAGLAIPFLPTALGISRFMVFYKNFRKYLHAVELFSGALLLFVGGLVFVNKLTCLSAKLTFLNRFSL